MKKKTCILMLAALTWLNVYQIGDAGEDAMEALQSSVQSAALSDPILTTPALPDDDDDADLPLIVSRALVHAPISFYIGQPLIYSLAKMDHFISHITIAGALRNLSPPNVNRRSAAVRYTRSYFFFAASARSLAPPRPIL